MSRLIRTCVVCKINQSLYSSRADFDLAAKHTKDQWLNNPGKIFEIVYRNALSANFSTSLLLSFRSITRCKIASTLAANKAFPLSLGRGISIE